MVARPCRFTVPALLLACSALAAAACGGGSGNAIHREALFYRFAGEEPALTFDPASLVQERPLLEWSPPPGPTRPGAFDVPLPSGRLVTERAQVVAVTVAGPRRDFAGRGAVRLRWWCEGGVEGNLQLEAVADVGEYQATYRFPVHQHPGWRGVVSRLRVEPTTHPNEPAVLRSVRVLHWSLRPEAWPGVVRRAWRVRIGDDVRTAFVAAPASALERTFVVPRRARFRFAYGCLEPAVGPVRFEVTVEAGQAPPRVVFSSEVGPGRPAGRWYDQEVDLSAWGGQPVRLTMRSLDRSPTTAGPTVPVWGQPEVWAASRSAPPAVVLIVLDTLRADRLSLYGHSRPTSPYLDAWARKRGIVFENAFAPSPWTLPSHASLFTGMNAARHGVNHGYPLPRSFGTMAEAFRRAGYATVAVTGGIYLTPEFGFDRGFESFTAWRGSDEYEVEAGVDRALSWLERLAGRPYFLFFHTYEVHAPYRPRQPHFAAFGGSPTPVGPFTVLPSPVPPRADQGYLVRSGMQRDGREPVPADFELLRRLYDSGVAHADRHVGRLLRWLDLQGDNLVVVVTSDHGEALGEHGLASHAYLQDFNLRVPLVLSGPGLRPRRTPEQVSLIDVFPAVAELAGLPAPSDIDGRSLRAVLAGDRTGSSESWGYAASTNQGVSLRVDGRWTYIFNNTTWAGSCGRDELSDRQARGGLLVSEPPAGLRPTLRSRVAEHLRSWESGLLVRFRNPSNEAFEGWIAAPFLHQVRLKTWGDACAPLRWDERRGRVEFRVKPRGGFAAVIEGVGVEALQILCRPGISAAVVDPSRIDRPAVVSYSGRTCLLQAEGSPLRSVGLTVEWTGDPRARAGGRPPADAQILQQLRALGYIQ